MHVRVVAHAAHPQVEGLPGMTDGEIGRCNKGFLLLHVVCAELIDINIKASGAKKTR